MVQIYEIFGYRIDDDSKSATEHRNEAKCPFMGCECDGGGNRYLSHINLKEHTDLQKLYPKRDFIPSGICSLQLRADETPWIVCPRRLLVLGKQNIGERNYQNLTENFLFKHCNYSSGQKIGVWPEVKLKISSKEKKFDYTFDYIIAPIGRIHSQEMEKILNSKWSKIQNTLQCAGYSICLIDREYYVNDFPLGKPTIIEIMTSSTSGGNKSKRTTIPMAFEDAMLNKKHNGPGINYRQVWARMVSQLVVKSEVALSWDGKAFWILQDKLVEYISRTTALNIKNFLSELPSEVNILSYSYADMNKIRNEGILQLGSEKLYSGPISSSNAKKTKPSFQDMIRAPLKPKIDKLFFLLSKRRYANYIEIQKGNK